MSGTTIPLELMFGGTPGPGLVVGVGLWADPLVDPSLEFAGETVDISDDVQVQLSRIGIFVDWYFKPTEGFHLLGTVTLDAFSLTDNETNELITNAKGPGVGVGFGYEWWIGKQWSVGPVVQWFYASLAADSESHSLWGSDITVSFTYH